MKYLYCKSLSKNIHLKVEIKEERTDQESLFDQLTFYQKKIPAVFIFNKIIISHTLYSLDLSNCC